MPKQKPPTPPWDNPVKAKANDPVFFYEEKFHFWDETWSNYLGPFNTEWLARATLRKYIYFLESGEGFDAPRDTSWKGF